MFEVADSTTIDGLWWRGTKSNVYYCNISYVLCWHQYCILYRC